MASFIKEEMHYTHTKKATLRNGKPITHTNTQEKVSREKKGNLAAGYEMRQQGSESHDGSLYKQEKWDVRNHPGYTLRGIPYKLARGEKLSV